MSIKENITEFTPAEKWGVIRVDNLETHWEVKGDIIEVVRCKDCKHNPKIDILDEICPFVNPPKDDFFCKYGKRREDD